MALTEKEIKALIGQYLVDNSITLSDLDTSDGDDVWVFGTQGSGENKKSVKIKLSDLKGKDGETTQEVSVYKKSETHPDAPAVEVSPDGTPVVALPPEGWLLKQNSKDGVWWVSKGTFVVNPDKIYSEDPEDKYSGMIGGWSIPYKITVVDGTTTTEKFRYYASKSATKPPSISSEYLNNPNTPGDGWEEKYELVIDPSVLKDGVARYNTNAKPPVYLWETKAVALNSNELLVPWSEPTLKSAYGGDKGETPVLTPVLNIESSGQFMLCDSNSIALPGQVIKIIAKPQNFKGVLDASNVKFKMTPYNASGGVISDDDRALPVNMGSPEFPFAELKTENWDSSYARVEVTCTIIKDGVTRTATTTIFRYSNAKDGDSVILGYLNPPSVSLVADEQDGIDYEDFRGQFILLDGGVTIIDAETNNADVKFNIKNVTDGGFKIEIVENRKWKNNLDEIIGDADDDESDGMFKITGDSSNYRNMSATIESVHRGFKSPALFTVNKIKDTNREPPVQNTEIHERIFTLTKDRTNPTIEVEANYPRFKDDNFVPNDLLDGDNISYTPDYIKWYGTPQDVDEIYTHQWVSERFKTNGEWGDFRPPYLWTNYFVPKINSTPQLDVFLENPMDVFSGVKGGEAIVAVRSYLGEHEQTPELIQIGENVDINKGEYDIFNFEITPLTQKITFTLRENSEHKTGEIPINVKVNGVDYLLFFKYIISPRGEGGKTHIVKLTTSSVTFTRDLTDTDGYTGDSEPEVITVVGHHLNMNELEWSFQIDGAGEYVKGEPTQSGVRGVSIGEDHIVTITTAELKDVSKSLNIRLKAKCEGTKIANNEGVYEDVYLWDIVSIRAIFNGHDGIPGKTPFTLEWVEGDPHRNNSEYVDFIYYRGDENQEKNGWFRLKDEHVGTYIAPKTPYTTGGLINPDYEKIDSAGTKAFDLVIAEEANLAGFVFKNNKLYSQDMLTVPGNTSAKLMLDGVNGVLTALNAKIVGEITAKEGKIGGFDIRNSYLMGQHRVYADGDNEGSLVVTTGLNANASTDSIAFWAGGTHEEAKRDEVGAIIKHDGSSKFTNADITGKITAKEGKIGGFEVRGNNLIGHNEAKVATLGLNANADDDNNDGIAFWAGAPIEGKVHANAIIRHDGFAKFKYGEIGGFNIAENMLVSLNAGIQGAEAGATKTAFWAGGTYNEAKRLMNLLDAISDGGKSVGKTANFVVNHSGASKLGIFVVDQSGRVNFINPNTAKSFGSIDNAPIPKYTDLLSNSHAEDKKENYARTFNYSQTSSILQNTVYAFRANGAIEFRGTATFSGSIPFIGNAQVELILRKDGIFYKSIYIDVFGRNYAPVGAPSLSFNNTTVINERITDVPVGSYSVEFKANYNQVHSSTRLDLTKTYLEWVYAPYAIKSTQIGNNGFMAWFGADKHIHISDTEGLKIKGIPADSVTGAVTTAFARVASNAVMSGSTSYLRAGLNLYSSKRSLGKYTLAHNLNTFKYICHVTPTQAARSAAITLQDSSYIDIEFRDEMGDLKDSSFSFSIIELNN